MIKSRVDVVWIEHPAVSSRFDVSSSRLPLDRSAIIYARASVRSTDEGDRNTEAKQFALLASRARACESCE